MSTTTGTATKVVACSNCGTKNRLPAAASGAPRCAKCQAPLPWVVDASDADFATVVDQADIPVLVDVWAPWCGPCRMVSPVLERLAGDFAGDLKLVKVNADDNPEVSRRFEVQAIPTLVLLDHGVVTDKQIGAAPAAQLEAWLKERLGKGSS
jgi:thioredoxin 2